MSTNKKYLEAYNLVFNWISEKNPNMNIDSISEMATQFAKMYIQSAITHSTNDESIDLDKPSWDDAPYWANYLAMDDGGYWYWYELLPNTLDFEWITDGQYLFAGKSKYSKFSWGKSLERKPIDL